MKSDIANLSNNPQQLDPPFLLFLHELTIAGKVVIAVQVPLSSQIHRHGGEIILRSEDGDYRLRGTHQLAGLANRKLSLFSEQRVVPHLTTADLRPELFDKARRLMRSGDRLIVRSQGKSTHSRQTKQPPAKIPQKGQQQELRP